jgi:predicted metal-binding membrane protein
VIVVRREYIMIRPVSDQRLFLPLVAVLVALAWLALWLWGQSPYAGYLSHHSLQQVRGSALLMLVFIGGWTLMIVAMMLPTSLPLAVLFHRLTRRRPHRARLMTLLLVGYLGVWGLFGALVYAGDSLLHELFERLPGLEVGAWAIAAATLALAGLYQFTPLKRLCLEKCRSPLSFVLEHWRGRNDTAQALRLGAHHGLFCLGCCWSLMLLMFTVGVGNLGWMLALGAIMAVEKNLPWGRRLSAPLGLALLAWSLAVVLDSVPGLS